MATPTPTNHRREGAVVAEEGERERKKNLSARYGQAGKGSHTPLPYGGGVKVTDGAACQTEEAEEAGL